METEKNRSGQLGTASGAQISSRKIIADDKIKKGFHFLFLGRGFEKERVREPHFNMNMNRLKKSRLLKVSVRGCLLALF